MLCDAHRDFVDVRTYTVLRLATLHTLVCDGHDEGQEGGQSGCVIWNVRLGSLQVNTLYCLLLHMRLHTVKYLLHMSWVHCC